MEGREEKHRHDDGGEQRQNPAHGENTESRTERPISLLVVLKREIVGKEPADR